jgi:hypothetical protein
MASREISPLKTYFALASATAAACGGHLSVLWFLDLDFSFNVEETHSFLDFQNSKGIRQLLSLQKLPRLLDLSGFLGLLGL